MNVSPAIELREVTVIYDESTTRPVVALKSVSLQVQRGETMFVTGGNGSGKTTLLRAVAGTAPIKSGAIMIDGLEVTNWPARRRAELLGFIYQDPMLGTCPNMTLYENLRLVTGGPWWRLLPEALSMDRDQAQLITDSGLPFHSKAATVMNSLSGGQRQGAALILALSSNRVILLMDEFTSALDERVRKLYLEMIQRESVRRRLTILGVVHDRTAIDILGTRTVHLENGAIND